MHYIGALLWMIWLTGFWLPKSCDLRRRIRVPIELISLDGEFISMKVYEFDEVGIESLVSLFLNDDQPRSQFSEEHGSGTVLLICTVPVPVDRSLPESEVRTGAEPIC